MRHQRRLRAHGIPLVGLQDPRQRREHARRQPAQEQEKGESPNYDLLQFKIFLNVKVLVGLLSLSGKYILAHRNCTRSYSGF